MLKAYTSEDNTVNDPMLQITATHEIPCHRHGGGWQPKLSDRTLAHIRHQLEEYQSLHHDSLRNRILCFFKEFVHEPPRKISTKN